MKRPALADAATTAMEVAGGVALAAGLWLVAGVGVMLLGVGAGLLAGSWLVSRR